MEPHRQDLKTLGLLVTLATAFGLLIGRLGWALFAATAIYLVMQHRELQRFAAWAQRPLTRPDNQRESWQEMASSLFRSIWQSRERTHAAVRQLQAMRTLSQALPDGVVVVDANGNIEQFNDAAASLLNLARRDRGSNLASLIRQPDFVALVRGRIGDDLVEFASPFAEGVRLEARHIPFNGGRALVLVRDVTQLNRLLSMRQDFIANVSHELRTPLTVIVGYIETLISEDIDAETTQTIIQKLASPSRRMQALVDDLLLLTRLEASPNPTDEELVAIDMPALIRNVAADTQALSHGKHDFDLQLAANGRVMGIENELHSASANLVANAIRYSPDGGLIQIAWQPVEGGMRFSVRDHGIGIPAEHLSRITERFYRVDLAQARTRGGTGLGLAIVKHVLKRHNSQLQVESELGSGSTFFFDIPDNQLATEASSSSTGATGQ